MRGEETVINHSYSIERYCIIKHCIAICLTLYIVDFMVYVIVFIKVIRGKLLLETKYIYIPVFFLRGPQTCHSILHPVRFHLSI